tara:strand:+ start:236 stop:655 length:420 start_codon:yes stop_codon:yes gene_type:complete
MELPSKVMEALKGEKKTFKQVQSETMKTARENDLSESQAETLLRRNLRKEGIPLPKSMAKEQELSKGGDISKKVPIISIGVGMAEMRKGKSKDKKGKTAMMRGGMANGKQHMYAAGGMVNDGLKALAKTRPDVVAKILK